MGSNRQQWTYQTELASNVRHFKPKNDTTTLMACQDAAAVSIYATARIAAGTFGTVQRFERSGAVEPFERFEHIYQMKSVRVGS
jgi:hypothetical protein